ncbi:HAD family hydrolase [Candidatus Woesearchaeota archaeon]|nr:HAD family hydrolase [Candidatus Woesearchaeota archaeon]
MIKAVVFDLYGTLLSIQQETRPYHQLFCDLGLTATEAYAARYACLTENLSLDALVQRFRPNCSLASYEAAVQQEVASVALYPESMDVLRFLCNLGLPLGLVSNLATPYKEPFYRLGLGDMIATQVFSCDVGTLKPEPLIYEKTLALLNMHPQHVLFVGDKQRNDVDGPLTAGMHAVLLDRQNKSSYVPRIETLRGLTSCL